MVVVVRVKGWGGGSLGVVEVYVGSRGRVKG